MFITNLILFLLLVAVLYGVVVIRRTILKLWDSIYSLEAQIMQLQVRDTITRDYPAIDTAMKSKLKSLKKEDQ